MLKKKGLYIGLISNCFSEEVEAIKESKLYPYFDRAYLSFAQGVQKPDKEIFIRCMNGFDVKAEECLYIGDGGSFELETASKLGMTAIQAVWYLRDGTMQPSKRKEGFLQCESPLEILKYCYLEYRNHEWKYTRLDEGEYFEAEEEKKKQAKDH